MSKRNPEQQSIEQLRERFDTLRDLRTTAQANLRSSADALDKLKAEAREKYGTDDPAQLATMLENLRADNERKRSEYQAQLDAIETALKAIEPSGTQA